MRNISVHLYYSAKMFLKISVNIIFSIFIFWSIPILKQVLQNVISQNRSVKKGGSSRSNTRGESVKFMPLLEKLRAQKHVTISEASLRKTDHLILFSLQFIWPQSSLSVAPTNILQNCYFWEYALGNLELQNTNQGNLDLNGKLMEISDSLLIKLANIF